MNLLTVLAAGAWSHYNFTQNNKELNEENLSSKEEQLQTIVVQAVFALTGLAALGFLTGVGRVFWERWNVKRKIKQLKQEKRDHRKARFR